MSNVTQKELISSSVSSQNEENVFDVDGIIDRLLMIYGAKSDSAYSTLRGVARSTVGNWRKRKTIPYSECEHAFLEHNASLDWIFTGEGSMYRAKTGVYVPKDDGSDVHYRVNVNSKGVANVVNNHGVNNGNIVAQGGTDRTEQGGNEQLLINFITWFMKNHDATDQAWLVGQLARSVPEFKEWRDNPPT